MTPATPTSPAPDAAPGPIRCPWPRTALDVAYHDAEWGVPERDDHRLFELLTLEGAQSGLSWSTILAKREGYRRVFHGFDPARVARMTAADLARALADPGVVRHRAKLESVVANARVVLRVQAQHGSLAALLWELAGPGAPRTNAWRTTAEVPSVTPESTAMSRALLRLGFRFVGPTTCYALMQAAGMVNDHLVDCVRHGQIAGAAAAPPLAAPGARSPAPTG